MSTLPPPGAALKLQAPVVFDRGGWHLEADIRPLSESKIIDELARDEHLCKVPDMLCGGAALRLVHKASSTLLEFSARDALLCCRWQPKPPAALLPPLRSASSASSGNGRTSSYATGEVSGGTETEVEALHGPLLGAIKCQFADHWRPHAANPDVKELEVTSDWTCSTPYWGSASCLGPGEEGRAKRLLDPSAWEATEEGLPMELLRRRDEILWYQEILFWEDELADNGLCRASVRVRVMPEFWFALLLCEVRVDNVLLREVGTRMFCRFGSDHVLREWTWKEATFEALRERGVKLTDNPQISHDSIGTVLLGEQDIQKQFRHILHLLRQGEGAS